MMMSFIRIVLLNDNIDRISSTNTIILTMAIIAIIVIIVMIVMMVIVMMMIMASILIFCDTITHVNLNRVKFFYNHINIIISLFVVVVVVVVVVAAVILVVLPIFIISNITSIESFKLRTNTIISNNTIQFSFSSSSSISSVSISSVLISTTPYHITKVTADVTSS